MTIYAQTKYVSLIVFFTLSVTVSVDPKEAQMLSIKKNDDIVSKYVVDTGENETLTTIDETNFDLDDDFFNYDQFSDSSDGEDLHQSLITSHSQAAIELPMEEEVRLRDTLFEKFLLQVWREALEDILSKNPPSLNGYEMDPFHLSKFIQNDPQRGSFHIEHTGNSVIINATMVNAMVYGLSSMKLAEVRVTRGKMLTDLVFFMNISLVEDLVINGTYSMKGAYSWWNIDTLGERRFSVVLPNVSVTMQMHLQLSGSMEPCQHKVLLKETKLSSSFGYSSFQFDHIGPYVNMAINGLGVSLIQSQEVTVEEMIRDALQQKMGTLFCAT